MKLTKSQQFWADHVIACKKSGLSQAEYSRAHGLKKSSFSAQKHHLIKNGFLKEEAPMNQSSSFLEVRKPSPQNLCLELASGAKISFDTLPDPLWIGKLLGELDAVKLR